MLNNKDFYPTPSRLFNQLVGRDSISGNILEPSAGKGDMVKHIIDKTRHIKPNIDTIENDSDLANILIQEGYSLVWNDFLTYETYKEYDYIIMNPPFSDGVDHLLKAIELAENQVRGCRIYAIINQETIHNSYSNKRKELTGKLERHKANVDYVKDGFADAERKTSVEVALIRMNITKHQEAESIYKATIENISGFNEKYEELETALSLHVKNNEINARMNEIEKLVLEYEQASKLIKQAYFNEKQKEHFLNYISQVNKKEGETVSSLYSITLGQSNGKDVNEELAKLRRGYWELILDTKEFRGLLTNEAIQKLNRQISMAEDMEINLTNIKMLLVALNSNREDILTDSIVSIFKKITRYHMNQYSTNIHYYNGWKTNDAYKINKKIIVPIQYSPFDIWEFKENYSQLSFEIRSWIDDMVKAFKLIDNDISNDFELVGENEFENDLLRFKMFKNGNIHIWFKDLSLLNRLNYICGKHFNWIPSEEEQKTNEKAKEFVRKEFGDVQLIELGA